MQALHKIAEEMFLRTLLFQCQRWAIHSTCPMTDKTLALQLMLAATNLMHQHIH